MDRLSTTSSYVRGFRVCRLRFCGFPNSNQPLQQPTSINPPYLRKSMATLPENQRSALELTKLGQYSVKSTAAQLNLTEGNVKILVHRALNRLRELMTDGRGHG